ncbi:MAG: hypothetical protein AAF656_03715, partial [Planctomycetota bacterium]
AAQLLVAEAALASDDLPAAHRALVALRAQPLGTDHFAAVLLLELDYQSRLGLWEPMVHNKKAKLETLDLRPGKDAALGSALIALAQAKLGVDDGGAALSERAGLLADPATLVEERPLLGAVLKTDVDGFGGADKGD